MVHAYHDEVKPERGRFRFYAHGVLFIPDSYREFLLHSLAQARKTHDFMGEVHYTKIRGAKDPRFFTARDWLSTYFENAVAHCPFKAFIVEQEGVRLFPYPGDEGYAKHAAHSLITTFVAGIAWSYSKAASIHLRPVFDDTDNIIDKAASVSLPFGLSSEISQRRLKGGSASYPYVECEPTQFVTSDPLASGDAWGDAELVQLCDLLLGAAIDTLGAAGRSPKTGRLRLSKSVAEVLVETLKVPWFQQVPVHRKFSVSLYPDDFNLAYPAALRQGNKEQHLITPVLPGFEAS